MPLTVGGKTVGPSDDQLLTRLAECWVEAAERATTVQSLESQVARMGDWLDAHKGDERYNHRLTQYLMRKDDLRRAMNAVHDIASAANRITDKMDTDLTRRAQVEIHAWAGIGGPGIYALTWNIVPNQKWLDDADADAQDLRQIEVPF